MKMAGQESFTLYRKADAEGYLEKINSSKWLPGKSRVWCELFGTVLYIFKESKRSSTGSQQVDMKQVHTVRKSTSDKSGTQLEIISKNKQHTFCAASAEECSNWVRFLQTAMTLSDQEERSSPKRTVTLGDYETISVLPEDNPSSSRVKIGASSDSGYTEVELPDPALAQTKVKDTAAGRPPPCQPLQVEDEAGYSQVEFRKSQGPKQPPSASAPDKPVIVEDSDGYAVVEMRKKSCSEMPRSSESAAGAEVEEKKEPYIYSTVAPKAVREAEKLKRSGSTSQEETPEGSSDEDDLLIAAALRQPDPIPAFPHPLQLDDLQPLADLQEFLSSHEKLCRASFSDRTLSEDPVGDLKKLLEEVRLRSV